MKVLLTGANGYIGTRLLPLLLEKGHTVVAMVRDRNRFHPPEGYDGQIEVFEADLLQPKSETLPSDIEAAYYLVHSMKGKNRDFSEDEDSSADRFVELLKNTQCRKIIYLGGLGGQEATSEHMSSRWNVEQVLQNSSIPTTTLRAGIVIGSGSASFEIIRDLVEKLPFMITPRWVESRCQPIGISDVLFYLTAVLDHPECTGKSFDIGGLDQLSYRRMLLILAEERGFRRYILRVPVLTPRLSSYWLYFVTSTNYSLASALVESMTVDALCTNHEIQEIIPHNCLTYREAIQRAFSLIEQNAVLSSWKDAFNQGHLESELSKFVEVPQHGCLKHQSRVPLTSSRENVTKNIWALGGQNGWPSMNWAWRLRGFADKIVGGVGLRRGRTLPHQLKAGDALDFWRILLADRENGHLLLFAEMKLPGEAWLEFKIEGEELVQTATFRPRGLSGRLYWWVCQPAHFLLFPRMAKALAGHLPKDNP